eukprot:366132-Chlamydomonas_euryale.AAC.4
MSPREREAFQAQSPLASEPQRLGISTSVEAYRRELQCGPDRGVEVRGQHAAVCFNPCSRVRDAALLNALRCSRRARRIHTLTLRASLSRHTPLSRCRAYAGPAAASAIGITGCPAGADIHSAGRPRFLLLPRHAAATSSPAPSCQTQGLRGPDVAV